MDTTGKTVLIIEDEEFLAKVLNDKLTKAGYAIIQVNNGAEGIQKVKADKPNLVLLDIMLPIKNGVEVLEAIRKDKTMQDTPVIIITNLESPPEEKRCKELGVLDYLIKSNMSLSEVEDVVNIHLQSLKK